VAFSYNVGTGALVKSTLLKKAKVNSADPSIVDEFLKWNKAGGKALTGLTNRRREEANLYFSLCNF
jgi:lysozyme